MGENADFSGFTGDTSQVTEDDFRDDPGVTKRSDEPPQWAEQLIAKVDQMMMTIDKLNLDDRLDKLDKAIEELPAKMVEKLRTEMRG